MDFVSRIVDVDPQSSLLLVEEEFVEGKTIDLSPYMHRSPVSMHLNSSVTEVYNLFRLAGLRHLVVTHENGTVAGIVTRKDLLLQIH